MKQPSLCTLNILPPFLISYEHAVNLVSYTHTNLGSIACVIQAALPKTLPRHQVRENTTQPTRTSSRRRGLLTRCRPGHTCPPVRPTHPYLLHSSSLSSPASVALNEPRRRLKLRQSFLTRNDIVRIYSSADQTKKPGPGAHNPEKVYVTTKKAPSFSLGIRHSEYITPLIVDVPDI